MLSFSTAFFALHQYFTVDFIKKYMMWMVYVFVRQRVTFARRHTVPPKHASCTPLQNILIPLST